MALGTGWDRCTSPNFFCWVEPQTLDITHKANIRRLWNVMRSMWAKDPGTQGMICGECPQCIYLICPRLSAGKAGNLETPMGADKKGPQKSQRVRKGQPHNRRLFDSNCPPPAKQPVHTFTSQGAWEAWMSTPVPATPSSPWRGVSLEVTWEPPSSPAIMMHPHRYQGVKGGPVGDLDRYPYLTAESWSPSSLTSGVWGGSAK